jgi:hypothetical protein
MPSFGKYLPMANTYIHGIPCATMTSYEPNISPNTYPKFMQNPLNFHLTSTHILVQTKLEVVEAFSNAHSTKYTY